MKAYEATLTIDGKWKATITGDGALSVLDEIVSSVYMNLPNGAVKAKEIQITVKEI